VAYFSGGEVGSCRETAANGGDSGHPEPIPPAERLRAARRRSTASRRSSGWLLAVEGGDGHGGKLGYWEPFTGREGEQPGIGKKGREGLRGIAG
jgi:hypothetical protein